MCSSRSEKIRMDDQGPRSPIRIFPDRELHFRFNVFGSLSCFLSIGNSYQQRGKRRLWFQIYENGRRKTWRKLSISQCNSSDNSCRSEALWLKKYVEKKIGEFFSTRELQICSNSDMQNADTEHVQQHRYRETA